MKQIVRIYGGAVISGLVISLLFVFLFSGIRDDSGNTGFFKILGADLPGRVIERNGSSFEAYADETEREFPVIMYAASGTLTVGTYTVNDLVKAVDYTGSLLQVELLSMTSPDGMEWTDAALLTDISFLSPGIYAVRASAKDNWNRETVREVYIPVNAAD